MHYNNDNTFARHLKHRAALKTRQTVPSRLRLHRRGAAGYTDLHLLHRRKHYPQDTATRTLGYPVLHGAVADFLRHLQRYSVDPDSVRDRVLPIEFRAGNRLGVESAYPLCFRFPDAPRRRTPSPLPDFGLRL